MRGAGVDVSCAADVAEAECGCSESESRSAVTESAVHAAEGGVVKTSAGHVIEVHTVDVGFGVFGVVAANAEAHGLEVVAGGVVVDVVAGAGEGCYRLCRSFFVFKEVLVEEHVILIFIEDVVEVRIEHLDDAEVVNDSVDDVDVHRDVLIAVGHDDKHVISGFGGGNSELARRVGRCLESLVVEHHSCARNGNAGVGVDNGTGYACGLCKRRYYGRQQQ